MILTAALILVVFLSVAMYLFVMLHPKFQPLCTQDCNQGRNCTCVNSYPINQSS